MLHIGEKIKEELEKSGLSISEFSRRISLSRENSYAIFKRKSMDTDLLLKISQVLNHNFFLYYLDIIESEKLTQLRIQIDALQKEVTYLKKINELLEEKIR